MFHNVQCLILYVPHAFKILRKLGICYDKIVFGKPVADVYIDGRASNSHKNMEKEV